MTSKESFFKLTLVQKKAVLSHAEFLLFYSDMLFFHQLSKHPNRSRNATVSKAFFMHAFLCYDNIIFMICQKQRAGLTPGLSCADREAQVCSDLNEGAQTK